jgi:hypothetical protein
MPEDPSAREGTPIIDANDPMVIRFREESELRIKEDLEEWYGKYNRNTMRIMTLLATLVGRDVNVRENCNIDSPYVAFGDGALCLYVKPEVGEDDRAKYQAIIEGDIKPELVRIIKELDSVVQQELVAKAEAGLQSLEAARGKIDISFDPIDPRILAVRETLVQETSTQVRALLESAFREVLLTKTDK